MALVGSIPSINVGGLAQPIPDHKDVFASKVRSWTYQYQPTLQSLECARAKRDGGLRLRKGKRRAAPAACTAPAVCVPLAGGSWRGNTGYSPQAGAITCCSKRYPLPQPPTSWAPPEAAPPEDAPPEDAPAAARAARAARAATSVRASRARCSCGT